MFTWFLMFFWTELFNWDTDETDSFSSNFRNIFSRTNKHLIDKSSSKKSCKEGFSRCLAALLPVVLFPGRNRRRSPKNGALPSFQPIRGHFNGKKSRRNQFFVVYFILLMPLREILTNRLAGSNSACRKFSWGKLCRRAGGTSVLEEEDAAGGRLHVQFFGFRGTILRCQSLSSRDERQL